MGAFAGGGRGAGAEAGPGVTAQGWAGLVLIIVNGLALLAGLAIYVLENTYEIDRRRLRIRRYADREANKAAGRCADCDEGRPRDRWE